MDVCRQYQDSGRISHEDLRGANDQALQELKILVDADIARIAGQLLTAKAGVATKGEYSDPTWFRKATDAKGVKGQLSQRIQNELGVRRKQRARINHQEENESMVKALLAAMDLVLSPSQKEEVLETARNLKNR